jgi:cell division protein FtsW (lipid II flippase)
VKQPSLALVIPKQQIEDRLMLLAAVFVFLYAAILTISPAVRLHSWNASYIWQHWTGFTTWLAGFFIIKRQSQKRLSDHNPYLLPIAGILSGWGLLTIWRLDPDLGLRQTAWLAISLFVFWIGLRIPNLLDLLSRYKYIWLFCGLILTGLTFFFGTYPYGSGPHLWLGCCGIYLQPSEILKLLLVIYLAAYLAERLPLSFNTMQLLAPTFVLLAVTLLVLMAQRDLGTAILFIFIYTITIYLASGKRRILLISALLVFCAGVAAYSLYGVVRTRVDAWINPWVDPSGRSYQIVQSFLAVAAGGILGTGPGLGSPGVIPVVSSDFIFSAIAEETGLVGSLGLILLIGMFLGCGILIAFRASSIYQRYLAAGLTIYLTAQSILIIGGNIRLFPLTGVTLPFVSYGGSSLLTSFLALLFLCIISNQSERDPEVLPQPHPYLITTGILLASLAALAFAAGWWGLIRRDDLLTRSDNPRRTIANAYVARGKIMDRSNQDLVTTTGETGSFGRVVKYPPLGPVIGYAQTRYGFAGLEGSMDNYLRGLDGSPSSEVWYNRLIYSQPPPGLDLRLSIDLNLQEKADQLLGDKNGALVLLNAQTGEILAMATHPYYDPNQLEEKWNDWIKDPKAPFLNRAVQGQYPPGTSLSPFLLTFIQNNGQLPQLPADLAVNWQGKQWNCIQSDQSSKSWANAVSSGCPGALLALSKKVNSIQLSQLIHQLGLDVAPNIPLPVNLPSSINQNKTPDQVLFDPTTFMVSPLQMALAAAALSADGIRPDPRLALAVQNSETGWSILPSISSGGNPPVNGSSSTVNNLQVPGSPFWQVSGLAQAKDGPVTWYLGGTRQDWQGIPLALALVVEEDNPQAANQIGMDLLQETIQSK